jgi:hypothetical protein
MGDIQMYYTFTIAQFSFVHTFWRLIYGVNDLHERSMTWSPALVCIGVLELSIMGRVCVF